MNESRVKFLEQSLAMVGYNRALEALDWMKKEMCKEKGFVRHNGAHYYTHLVDTTLDLFTQNIRDEDILVACILHDAVEDVEGITVKYISDKFGSNVAEMVRLVTKQKGLNYKDPEVMRAYLEEIFKNPGASLIKTADRKHNFGTLREATAEKKMRQAQETKTLFIPFFKRCRKEYPRYAGYFFLAKTAIEPHLWEIEEHYEEVARLKEEIELLKGSQLNE